ncbi:MAG: CoA-binding protein [Moorellaceae bacterium]
MDFARISTIAVVGLSDKPDRPSYQVARYLQEQGYRIIPVNPGVAWVLGEKSYPSLKDIPPEISVDVVDIFRQPVAVPAVVEEAIQRGVKVIWMQEGISHPEAAARAREAGIEVIMDRCLKKEHMRFKSREAEEARI